MFLCLSFQLSFFLPLLLSLSLQFFISFSFLTLSSALLLFLFLFHLVSGDLLTFIHPTWQSNSEQAILILTSSVYKNWGLILDDINNLLSIVAVKSVYPPQELAERILYINKSEIDNNYGGKNSRKSSLTLSEGEYGHPKKWHVI